MSDFVLYQQDVEKLSTLLQEYIANAAVRCAFLTNKEGLLLSCEGTTDSIDTVSVAALITGSFNATVTIARLIGESEFTTMFHRGKKKHIHITLVDEERYLASVFDNTTTVQKVSYYASQCTRALREYLKSISGNVESAFLPEDEEGEEGDIFAQVFEQIGQEEIAGSDRSQQREEAKAQITPAEEETSLREEIIVACDTSSSSQIPSQSVVPEISAVRSTPATMSSSTDPFRAFLMRKIRQARAMRQTAATLKEK